MSSHAPSPPIMYNGPQERGGGRTALIEQVAIDLWLRSDDSSWQDAGDHWRRIFRELATTAVESVKRYETSGS